MGKTNQKTREIAQVIERVMISTISACMIYDPLLEGSKYKSLSRKDHEELLRRIQKRAKNDLNNIFRLPSQK